MLTINLEWDPAALAAPQSFRDGVQAAASIVDAAIADPITVNIQVGYGDIGYGGPQYKLLSGRQSFGGISREIQLSYPALRDALASNETSGLNTQVVNALPNAASLNGRANFSISSALAKSFGALPADNAALDGIVGFPTSFTGSGLLSTAVTEEIHALGLLNDGGDLGLVAYISPGNHFLPTYYTASAPAYFSVDGGTTSLANYNVNDDDTLFINQNNDPLDYPATGSTLTQLDLTEISAIGFHVGSTPVLQVPVITPGSAAPGTRAAVTAQNVSVAEGEAIPVSSFLRSVTAPAGDGIGYYGFEDTGRGPGHLMLNGVTEPAGSYVYVLPTQLNTLQFVGGSSAGSDTLFVYAYDYTANTFTQPDLVTATTAAPGAGISATPSYGIEANANLANPGGITGTTPYTFTVYRTGDASQAATLSYTVAGAGTNPAPASLFQNPAGSVALAAGVSSAVLTINALGTALANPERFSVSISGANGSIAAAVAYGTVGANAISPSYSIAASNANQPDGTTGTTPYTFTVSRTGDTSQAATLGYAVAGAGTNPAPVSLFQNPAGTVSLAAGASSAVVTINALGAPITTAEGFSVTISGGNGTIAAASASGTVGANTPLLDPGSIALNAAAVYGFANTGVPAFTAVVNQDGSADLGLGASALRPAFIGGYVAGIEVRVMANLEQTGASTAQIDRQFGRDMDSISSLLTSGNAAEGFGFLSGLTTGGPSGLIGVGVPAGLQGDIRAALGSDQQATGAVAGCIVGAVNFAQGYIDAINAGQGPMAALHGVEASALR